MADPRGSVYQGVADTGQAVVFDGPRYNPLGEFQKRKILDAQQEELKRAAGQKQRDDALKRLTETEFNPKDVFRTDVDRLRSMRGAYNTVKGDLWGRYDQTGDLNFDPTRPGTQAWKALRDEENRILAFAEKSNQDKAAFETIQKAILARPDEYTDEGKTAFAEWAAKPLGERGLPPQLDAYWDELAYQDKVIETFANADTDAWAALLGDGTIGRGSLETVSRDKLDRAALIGYSDSEQWQNALNKQFNALSDADKNKKRLLAADYNREQLAKNPNFVQVTPQQFMGMEKLREGAYSKRTAGRTATSKLGRQSERRAAEWILNTMKGLGEGTAEGYRPVTDDDFITWGTIPGRFMVNDVLEKGEYFFGEGDDAEGVGKVLYDTQTGKSGFLRKGERPESYDDVDWLETSELFTEVVVPMVAGFKELKLGDVTDVADRLGLRTVEGSMSLDPLPSSGRKPPKTSSNPRGLKIDLLEEFHEGGVTPEGGETAILVKPKEAILTEDHIEELGKLSKQGKGKNWFQRGIEWLQKTVGFNPNPDNEPGKRHKGGLGETTRYEQLQKPEMIAERAGELPRSPEKEVIVEEKVDNRYTDEVMADIAGKLEKSNLNYDPETGDISVGLTDLEKWVFNPTITSDRDALLKAYPEYEDVIGRMGEINDTIPLEMAFGKDAAARERLKEFIMRIAPDQPEALDLFEGDKVRTATKKNVKEALKPVKDA